MKIKRHLALITSLAIAALAVFGTAQDEEAPPLPAIKALLVTGEGYHDYEAQKRILSEGISERLDVDWTIWHHHTADEAKADLSKPGWADPYDIVVYNICHAKEADKAFVESVAKVHKDGKPAVALHCTMHSYHWKVDGNKKAWTDMLGVSSRNHGPKAPIKVLKVPDLVHPVTKDLPDGWTTPAGELYNVNSVSTTATVLAHGENGIKKQGKQVVIWINQYGKGRIVGTTIGHHNETMETKEYLDMISNGIEWAVGR